MKISTKPSPPTTRFDAGATPAEGGGWGGTAERLAGRGDRRRGLRDFAARRPFLLAVILPTLLAAIYFFAIAADQYVSEARFVVRGRAQAASSSAASGLGDLLGAVGLSPAHEEAQAVRDYLTSHGAVLGLEGRLDLPAIFTRPESDLLARLWWDDPERLTRYFTSMVTTTYDSTSGMVVVRTRTFRAEDSRTLTEELLRLSEALVNRMSENARADALRIGREEVEVAERRVLAARAALTEFRSRQQAMDPTRSAAIATESLGVLEGQLTAARAELTARSAFMRPDNPGLHEVRNRIAALERQIVVERARHTSGDATLSHQLAEYERLQLEREFADRQLASAVASMEGARVEAQRQQVFVSRVVEPNLAEYPLYPRRILNVLGIFVGLSVAYGISWLLLAGMREHAA